MMIGQFLKSRDSRRNWTWSFPHTTATSNNGYYGTVERKNQPRLLTFQAKFASQRLTDSFRLLAQNEDWLGDNFEKMIRLRDVSPGDEVVGKRLDGKSVAE